MEFRLQELEKATDNFAKKQIVGSGGYGHVYKGIHEGKEIAVKKLHPLIGLDDKDFMNEFHNLSKVRHENVVRLLGYCYETRRNFIEHNGELNMATIKERILCFDYMQGGSLDDHIKDDLCDLDWPVCYKVITGTCEGVNHLHAHDKPIFHLDLKPANILLDKNMTAKIADLGLSKLVNSTQTHRTKVASLRGTIGYMPPEYLDEFAISKKFDVYSLGAIIIRILDGNKYHYRYSEMGAEKFIENVIGNWDRRLPGTSTSSYSSHKEDILRVKMCVQIALRCVEKDRKKRPSIKDIVQELEELEAEIKKMSLDSENSEDLIGQTSSGCSTVLSFDPSQELRFLFETGKSASTCLQLTNMTEGSIAFNIKTNKRKYCAQPNTGVMPPCSKRYISVTLKAQEEAALNMQCHDMFVVQSAHVNEDLTSDEISNAFLEEGKVDIMKMPIVYIAADQFPRSNF